MRKCQGVYVFCGGTSSTTQQQHKTGRSKMVFMQEIITEIPKPQK